MKIWLLCMSFILVLAPVVAFAVDTPEAITEMPDELVPCGDPGQVSCQTCHLYQLAENVSEWIFGVATFIVILLIIYGGMRMVTSTGNQVAMRDARKLVGTAVVGFALVLSAWTIIDLMIATLSNTSAPMNGIWSSLECVEETVTEEVVRTQVCTRRIQGGLSAPGCTECVPDSSDWRSPWLNCQCRTTLAPGQLPESGCTVETATP